MISDRVFDTRQALQDLFESGALRARQRCGPVLVSFTVRVQSVDPIDFFTRAHLIAGDRVYWELPRDGFALVGVGAAQVISASGTGRFAHVREAWHKLLAGALVDNPTEVPGTGPVLIGGFSFDPLRPRTQAWDGYPDGALILPKFLLALARGESWLTMNAVLRPESNLVSEADSLERGRMSLFLADSGDGPEDAPRRWQRANSAAEDVRPAADWMATVGSLADEIKRGELEKVVLAREVLARSPRPFSPTGALRALRHEYPGCYLFAVARGERCFLGATPERLVRLRGGEIRTTCLAGSTARGLTAEDDERLGNALLASEKNRAEHAVVVRVLRDALAPVCVDVSEAAEPTLLKLPNVQHLYTPVTGRLAKDHTLLDVIERIHPTPAVGGFPQEKALSVIREREGLDRGWYAGPVGWLDPSGEGEFAVAIRSTLLQGTEASLFAGCGIVAGSDPACEYEESCLKLRPMLSALKASASEASGS